MGKNAATWEKPIARKKLITGKKEKSKPEIIYTDEELFSTLKNDKVKLTTEELDKAKSKDGNVLNKIGRIYFDNKRNNSKALAWFRRAADQNNGDAQCSIGNMYDNGFGVPKSHTLAMEWYLKSANRNANADAQWHIGRHYYEGISVPPDVHIAIAWYTKSANQKDKDSAYFLGEIYETDWEVMDLQKAADWYERASEYGNLSARRKLSNLRKKDYFSSVEMRDRTKREYNQQIAEVTEFDPNKESVESRINLVQAELRKMELGLQKINLHLEELKSKKNE